MIKTYQHALCEWQSTEAFLFPEAWSERKLSSTTLSVYPYTEGPTQDHQAPLEEGRREKEGEEEEDVGQKLRNNLQMVKLYLRQ